MQRARIVVRAARTMADTEIARRRDTSPGLIGRWRRRFAELGLDGSKDRPRVGRSSPLGQVAAGKPVACELPARYGLPVSRFSALSFIGG